MSTSLEGYAVFEAMSKGSGLEALRKDMSMRLARNSQSAAAGKPKAA